MSDDKTRVNLKVSSDKKDAWAEAVESNPQYDSMSHLIRTAVERELSDSRADAPAAAAADVDADALRAVQQRLGELHSEVEDVNRGVEALREASPADTDASNAKANAWQALGADGATAAEVADATGPPTTVEDAVAVLAEMVADGHVDTDGETYRRVD